MEQSDRNGEIWPKNLVKLFHVWYLHWCFRRWKRPNHLSLTSMSSFPGLELSSSANGVFASSAISFSKINFIGSFCNLICINPVQNTGNNSSISNWHLRIQWSLIKLQTSLQSKGNPPTTFTTTMFYVFWNSYCNLSHVMKITRNGSYQVATQSVSHSGQRSTDLGVPEPSTGGFFWFRMDGGISSSTTTHNKKSTFIMIYEWFSSYMWMSPRTMFTRFIHKVRPHILTFSNSRTE